jgi:hypothetical protein
MIRHTKAVSSVCHGLRFSDFFGISLRADNIPYCFSAAGMRRIRRFVSLPCSPHVSRHANAIGGRNQQQIKENHSLLHVFNLCNRDIKYAVRKKTDVVKQIFR